MRKVIKDKRFIFFTSIILLTYFFICQIVLITMIGKDNALAIIIGAFTVVVGLSGAIVAYFIAIAQIDKQDSNRIVDLKIENYTKIIKHFEDLIAELRMYNSLLNNELTKNKKNAGYIFIGEDKNVERKRILLNVQEDIQLLKKYKVYFKTIDIEDKDFFFDQLFFDVVNSFNFEFKYMQEKEDFTSIVMKLETVIFRVEIVNNYFVSEIENILLK